MRSTSTLDTPQTPAPTPRRPRWRPTGSLLLIALLCLVGWKPLTAVAAAGRWALVVGNDAYTRVEALRNAVADATLIAAELERAGFDVVTVRNADRRRLLREVIELSRRAEGGGEAVLYFAGHGVQIANTNYLLPVDFDGSDEAMLPFEAVSLTDIGNQLLDAKTRFSLLIVDACRNNPLTGRRGRNLRSGPGLAPMSPATGQMIVFSAGSGQVALDGLGDRDPVRNGVFAREFAREMRTPGRDVRELMVDVRESVERLAASVNHAQRPAIYDESRGRFVFNAEPAPAIAAAVASAPTAGTASAGLSSAGNPSSDSTSAATRGKSPDVIEDELWAAFSGSGSRAGFAAYLREYPNGRYAAAARVQLEILGAPVASAGAVDRGAATIAAPAGAAQSAAQTAAAPPAAAAPAVLSAAAPLSPPNPAAGTARGALNGRRFKGADLQFALTVLVNETGLVVEDFRITSGRFSGTDLRCGTFRSRIDLDEALNVKAFCNGIIPGVLRISGRFPRIDIQTSGAFGGGAFDLAEISPSGAVPR